jgi:hypothetical protein
MGLHICASGIVLLFVGAGAEVIRATFPLSRKADRRADRISSRSTLTGGAMACIGLLILSGLI